MILYLLLLMSFNIYSINPVCDESSTYYDETACNAIEDNQDVEVVDYQAGGAPKTARQFANDSIKTNELLDKILVKANNNNNQNSPLHTDYSGFIKDIVKIKDMYQQYTGSMGVVDQTLNTGDYGNMTETHYAYGSETRLPPAECHYCDQISSESDPYKDVLDATFVETIDAGTKLVNDMIRGSGDEKLKDIYLEQEKEYKYLKEDYKNADFYSVRTNEKFNDVLESASRTLLSNSKLAVVNLEKYKKCTPKECKEMRDSISKINSKMLARNFEKKVNSAARIQINYMKANAGKNTLLKDATVEKGLYASGINIFSRVHRHYRIKYMAGLFFNTNKRVLN